MEEIFNKFKKEGQNNVNSIVQWFRDSNIKLSEEDTRQLFQDAADKTNVDWEMFLQAVGKVAHAQKTTIEEISKTLGEEGPKVLVALMEGANAAVTAFSKAMKK